MSALADAIGAVQAATRDLQRRAVALTAAGILVVFMTVSLLSAFHSPGPTMDEGQLLVYPERVLHGAVPHRDFETAYGPGNLWFLAAVYTVFGVTVGVERTVAVLYRVVIVLAVFALAYRFGWKVAVESGLLAGFVLISLNWGLPALAWLGAVGLALWSLWFLWRATSPPRGAGGAWQVGGAGLLAGVVLLFRPDMAPAVLVSGLPLLQLASRHQRWAYAAGFVAGVLPFGLHLIMASPRAVVDQLITAVVRIRPGRALPIPPTSLSLALYFSVVIGGALILFASGAVAVWHRRRNPEARAQLSLGLFALALLPQVFQRADRLHVAMVGCLTLGLLPAALSSLAEDLRPALPARRRELVVAGVAALLAIPIFVRWVAPSTLAAVGVRPSPAYFVGHGGRTWPVGSAADAADIQALLQDVDQVASPGQRLFVGPRDLRRTTSNDTFLYFLLPGLPPATYYLEMNPGSANASDSHLATDLASADVVILDNRWDTYIEPNASRRPGPEAPMNVIRSLFCLHSEHGHYQLLLRCGP